MLWLLYLLTGDRAQGSTPARTSLEHVCARPRAHFVGSASQAPGAGSRGAIPRPARCTSLSRRTLNLVTPLRPARAEASAEESRRLCRVGNHTEVALREWPRGLGLGSRHRQPRARPRRHSPSRRPQEGQRAQTGPALWTVPKARKDTLVQPESYGTSPRATAQARVEPGQQAACCRDWPRGLPRPPC